MSPARDVLRGLRASAAATLYGAPAQQDPVPASASAVPPTLGAGTPAAAGAASDGPAADNFSGRSPRSFSPRVACFDLRALDEEIGLLSAGADFRALDCAVGAPRRARLQAWIAMDAAAARAAHEHLCCDAWTVAIQAVIAAADHGIEGAAFAAVARALLPLIQRDIRRLEARIAHG